MAYFYIDNGLRINRNVSCLNMLRVTSAFIFLIRLNAKLVFLLQNVLDVSVGSGVLEDSF